MSIKLDIDLDAPGHQFGKVSISPDPAEGREPQFVEMPIISLRAGVGPTLVLTAGVHGDEYEGQVALSELGRSLDLERVNGQVIIMPTANGPACSAGTRNTPSDGLNLNRAFPGDPDGTFTRRLAHFIEEELYRRADYAVDFHCGGEILHFLPSTLFVVTGDVAADRSRLDLAAAFGARHCMLFAKHLFTAEEAEICGLKITCIPHPLLPAKTAVALSSSSLKINISFKGNGPTMTTAVIGAFHVLPPLLLKENHGDSAGLHLLNETR